MSHSPTTPPHSTIANTYGALYVGLIISAVLFGVTNLQVFFYLTMYRQDRIWHKLSVYWLWFFDAFHFALISHVVYHYLVSNYANPIALINIVWSFQVQIVVDVIVVVSVQTLYVVRLIQLNSGERRLVLWLAAAILVVAFGIGITQCWSTFLVNTFPSVSEKIGWTTYMSLTCAASIDAVIAGSLCFVLAKQRTGFSKTDSTVDVLMVYILNTGLLTSLCSVTAIIFFAAMPNNFIFLAVEFLLTKLYINSYMAMLNARQYLQARTDIHPTSDVELSASTGHSHEHGSSVLNISGPPMAKPLTSQFLRHAPSPTLRKSDGSDVDFSRPPLEVMVQKEGFTRDF